MDAAVRGVRRPLLWASRMFLGAPARRAVASLRNVCGAVAAGKQAIMPDAMEALRQHADQEAPDELVGGNVIVL